MIYRSSSSSLIYAEVARRTLLPALDEHAEFLADVDQCALFVGQLEAHAPDITGILAPAVP